MSSPDFTLEDGLVVFSRDFLLRRGSCCGSGCRHCPYPGTVRVVSMVPSWTETLLECGANVVGRTRFCIHPSEKVTPIPSVGGTKDWKFDSVSADLFVMDREENPEPMAKAAPGSVWASHVRSIEDMPAALDALADVLADDLAGDLGVSSRLRKLAGRWRRVVAAPAVAGPFPGVLESFGGEVSTRVVYLIWRDPWMCVSSETFIGSVLRKLGREVWPLTGAAYPEIQLEEIPADCTLLFSSEPFPFARRRDEIAALGRAAAIVDGESFSWFGVRSLRFLERALGLTGFSG
jgi:Family of unknown function (DUF5522)